MKMRSNSASEGSFMRIPSLHLTAQRNAQEHQNKPTNHLPRDGGGSVEPLFVCQKLCRLEREGGKGCERAHEPGQDDQACLAGNEKPFTRKRKDQPERKTADKVHDQNAPRKRGAANPL